MEIILNHNVQKQFFETDVQYLITNFDHEQTFDLKNDKKNNTHIVVYAKLGSAYARLGLALDPHDASGTIGDIKRTFKSI